MREKTPSVSLEMGIVKGWNNEVTRFLLPQLSYLQACSMSTHSNVLIPRSDWVKHT